MQNTNVLFFLMYCDQSFGAQFFEQIEDLALTNIRVNSVGAKQRCAQVIDLHRICQQSPDTRTHLVHPIACTLFNAESDNFTIDFGLDDIVPTRDDRVRRLER